MAVVAWLLFLFAVAVFVVAAVRLTSFTFGLSEYQTLVKSIIPVTAPLLSPHLVELESILTPGLTTLSWTSMNINSYKSRVRNGECKEDASDP